MFGKNIKKIRNVRGLSQQAFAEMFDLKRAALGAYEEGRSNPKLETVLKIANHFNLTADDLLFGELTVNRLLHFNDSITTNTDGLKTEEFAQIPCITESLQTAYIHNYSRKTFTDKLPRLHLPLNAQEEYIGYTVSGLEMSYHGRGFFPKDIVVGKKLPPEAANSISSGHLVLVLTANQLLFRRATARDGQLHLHADHDNVEPVIIPFAEIIQLWEACHAFHYRIPAKKDWMEERLEMLENKVLAMRKG